MKGKQLSILIGLALLLLVLGSGTGYADNARDAYSSAKQTDTAASQALDAKKAAMAQQGKEVSLEDMAEQIGIDPANMTKDELKRAFQQKMMQKGLDQKTVASETASNKSGQAHDKLLQKAKELGIDTKGMTDAQIVSALHVK